MPGFNLNEINESLNNSYSVPDATPMTPQAMETLRSMRDFEQRIRDINAQIRELNKVMVSTR